MKCCTDGVCWYEVLYLMVCVGDEVSVPDVCVGNEVLSVTDGVFGDEVFVPDGVCW